MKGAQMATSSRESTTMLGALLDRVHREVLGPAGFSHSGALRFRRPGEGLNQRLIFWIERSSHFANGRHLLGLRVEVIPTEGKAVLAEMLGPEGEPVLALPVDLIEAAAGTRHATWGFDSEQMALDHLPTVTRTLTEAVLPYLDARRSLSDLANTVGVQLAMKPAPADLMARGDAPVIAAAAALILGRGDQALSLLQAAYRGDPYLMRDHATAFKVVRRHLRASPQ